MAREKSVIPYRLDNSRHSCSFEISRQRNAMERLTHMKFEKEIAIILKSRRAETDMLNVIEALNYGPDQFQQAFEIALEMDNRNLVKLLYSNFDARKVIVEFTLLAKK